MDQFKNDALLMKNHNMRPTGSSPADFGHSFQGSAPETNVVQGGARGNFTLKEMELTTLSSGGKEQCLIDSATT
ncbi:hypothetical protein PIB30_112036, partial [Stylosanthes scabra]|nr:hypothetical protein [Stylosanthes scabra]